MKVLLDENLAHRLRHNLGAHEVVTVRYQGWAGLKNGNLLRTAEDNGIIVLSSVEWEILRHHLPSIIRAIDNATPGSIRKVDCGTFDRTKHPDFR